MLKASDIMTKDVATIRSSATVADALKLMHTRGWRTLIVEPQHEQDAYGIITTTDIVYKVLAPGKSPGRMRVYQIMTKPCIVVNPDLSVYYVARLFAENGLRIAPVIQEKLLGIISESDLLKREFLEDVEQAQPNQRLQEMLARARTVCEQNGSTSTACLSAWQQADAVEAEMAFQQAETLEKTAFEAFCEEYPETLETITIENWCSG